MGKVRTACEAVCHAAALYDRGVFCPGELWGQVVRVLTPESAAGVLDSLPVETQRLLRAVFKDRPSLPDDVDLAPSVAALVAWFGSGRV